MLNVCDTILRDLALIKIYVSSWSMKAITVCICTYNRYDLLLKLLAELQNQTLNPEKFNVLVVDNSPAESTQQVNFPVGAKFSGEVVRSSPPGLSRARNVGLERCLTPYIVYIDDDALPAPQWLEQLLVVFADEGRSVGAVGGPIDPVWPIERPAWLPVEIEGALTIMDYGDKRQTLDKKKFLYGTNISFACEALRQVGGFDLSLGRVGGGLLSGEETAVQEKLRQANYKIIYSPKALVRHTVHVERLSQQWFRKRFAWQAVSDAIEQSAAPKSRTSSISDLQGPQILGHLFKSCSDSDEFLAQIRRIESVMHQLLHDGELSQGVEASAPFSTSRLDSMSCAVAPRGTRLFFVEQSGAHDYLYGLFGRLTGAALVYLPFSYRDRSQYAVEKNIDFLRKLYKRADMLGASVFFLTIDPFLKPRYSDNLFQIIDGSGVESYGLLHRVEDIETAADSFKNLLNKIKAVFSYLSEDADLVKKALGSDCVKFIDHHDTHGIADLHYTEKLKNRAFPELAGRRVLAFIGEIREGKGIEFLIQAIPMIAEKYRDELALLVVGKGPQEVYSQLTEQCSKYELQICIDGCQPGQAQSATYRVVPDYKMDAYVCMADCVLLPYHGKQKHAMSGIVPSFARSFKPVLASRGTYVGKMVEANELGCVFDFGSVESLLSGIEKAKLANFSTGGSPKAAAFKERIADANILESIRKEVAVLNRKSE